MLSQATLDRIIHDVRLALTFQCAGNVFIGAAPEALAAGYAKDTPESRLFVQLFLNDCPEIETDSNDIIVARDTDNTGE